jgi:hypothetical protein
MLNRRTFVKLLSALGIVPAATADAAVRLHPITVEGFVDSIISEQPRSFEMTHPTDGESEHYHVVVTKKTKFTIKTYQLKNYHLKLKSTKKGKFLQLETGTHVKVTGKTIPGSFSINAGQVVIIHIDYGY